MYLLVSNVSLVCAIDAMIFQSQRFSRDKSFLGNVRSRMLRDGIAMDENALHSLETVNRMETFSDFITRDTLPVRKGFCAILLPAFKNRRRIPFYCVPISSFQYTSTAWRFPRVIFSRVTLSWFVHILLRAWFVSQDENTRLVNVLPRRVIRAPTCRRHPVNEKSINQNETGKKKRLRSTAYFSRINTGDKRNHQKSCAFRSPTDVWNSFRLEPFNRALCTRRVFAKTRPTQNLTLDRTLLSITTNRVMFVVILSIARSDKLWKYSVLSWVFFPSHNLGKTWVLCRSAGPSVTSHVVR